MSLARENIHLFHKLLRLICLEIFARRSEQATVDGQAYTTYDTYITDYKYILTYYTIHVGVVCNAIPYTFLFNGAYHYS